MHQFRRLPLWQWGLLLIVAGLVANVLTGMLLPAGTSAAARGQAFGRGLATLLAVIAGVVLIVMHFVRRPASRQPARPGQPAGKRRRRTRR